MWHSSPWQIVLVSGSGSLLLAGYLHVSCVYVLYLPNVSMYYSTKQFAVRSTEYITRSGTSVQVRHNTSLDPRMTVCHTCNPIDNKGENNEKITSRKRIKDL